MKSTYNSRTAIVPPPRKEVKPAEINLELKEKLDWVMKTKGALASKIINEWGESVPQETDKEYI
jgi:hypothetical protein